VFLLTDRSETTVSGDSGADSRVLEGASNDLIVDHVRRQKSKIAPPPKIAATRQRGLLVMGALGVPLSISEA
jgi:hypothetical protein